jgi:hypothetical protein
MKRAGLKCLYKPDSDVGSASERRKRNRGRTALLALIAELRSSKSRARTMERDSRRERREFRTIVFPGNVGVKGIREILPCKRSGGAGIVIDMGGAGAYLRRTFDGAPGRPFPLVAHRWNVEF